MDKTGDAGCRTYTEGGLCIIEGVEDDGIEGVAVDG